MGFSSAATCRRFWIFRAKSASFWTGGQRLRSVAGVQEPAAIQNPRASTSSPHSEIRKLRQDHPMTQLRSAWPCSSAAAARPCKTWSTAAPTADCALRSSSSFPALPTPSPWKAASDRRHCQSVVEPQGKQARAPSSAAAFSKCAGSSRADLVCLAGFLQLIEVPDDFTGRVMNIHPSLSIPAFCGKGFYGSITRVQRRCCNTAAR